jgi:undecaprenyl-diphosphatase
VVTAHEPEPLLRLDEAVYRAVARMPTPALDQPLRVLSTVANWSVLWFGVSGALSLLGGSRGRRAAATGLAAIAVTSLVVNQPMKRFGRRARPDREAAGVPPTRWVRMPDSTSFPSGHSASAAAFATTVGHVVPQIRLPLAALGGAVAFSRTYTGVHYPSDVAVGVLAGIGLGRLVRRVSAAYGTTTTGTGELRTM